MESIINLKKICSLKGHNKEKGIMRFYRHIAYYVVRQLLLTPLSANQVSLLSSVIAVSGSLLLISNNPWKLLIGALMLHLWYIGDYCDGSLARYYNKTKGTPLDVKGRFFDWLNIKIGSFSIFVCLILGSYFHFDNPKTLFLGGALIISWFATWVIPGLGRGVNEILQSNFVNRKKQRIPKIIYSILVILGYMFKPKRVNHSEIIPKKNRVTKLLVKVNLILERITAPVFIPMVVTIAVLVNMTFYIVAKTSLLKFNLQDIYFLSYLLIYWVITYLLLFITDFLIFVVHRGLITVKTIR